LAATLSLPQRWSQVLLPSGPTTHDATLMQLTTSPSGLHANVAALKADTKSHKYNTQLGVDVWCCQQPSMARLQGMHLYCANFVSTER
jgi:hypothetical protein